MGRGWSERFVRRVEKRPDAQYDPLDWPYDFESPLHEMIQLVRSPGGPRWSYFLRAETMHSHYTYLEEIAKERGSPPPPRLHERSHGESFVQLLRTRFGQPGFYLLDEPEAALSSSMVDHWRRFLDDPRRYLRHLLM